MSEEKTQNKDEVFKKIYENYNYMNKMMVEELQLASMHKVTTGNNREEMWLNFFERIVPKKFTLAQGVLIIDSKKNISKEVDICIYDNSYTPYVFQYNNLKFIPIEAVAVVIECKSGSWKPKDLKKWAGSIEKLETSSTGIARVINGYAIQITNKKQQGTKPIKILASIREDVSERMLKTISDSFDFIIYKNDVERLEVEVPNKSESLGWWGKKLNNNDGKLNLLFLDIDNKREELSECKPKNFKYDSEDVLTSTLEDLEIPSNPILSLNLQLNQLLMLINNPMQFPHFAYAQVWRDLYEDKEEKNEEVNNANKIKDNNKS